MVAKILSTIRPVSKIPQTQLFIDLIITNRPKSFQESQVIKDGLPDFHKMSLIIRYRKQKDSSSKA